MTRSGRIWVRAAKITSTQPEKKSCTRDPRIYYADRNHQSQIVANEWDRETGMERTAVTTGDELENTGEYWRSVDWAILALMSVVAADVACCDRLELISK